MSETTGRLSGERANRIRDRIVERHNRNVERLVSEYMASGYPPFTDPLSPYEQYQKLIAMRGAGDPAFWNDPRAQAELARLEQRFGPVDPLMTGPLGEPVPARPASVLGATVTAQRLGPPGLGGGLL